MRATTTPASVVGRLVPGICLAIVAAIAFTASRAGGEAGNATLIANLGFLLVAGTLLSELVGFLRLPHLTGYLLAGAFAGPHVLGIVDTQTAARLAPVNTLALAMIALAGGAELRLDQLRARLRSLVVATGVHSIVGVVASAALFFAFRRFIPFASNVGTNVAIAIALLWGVLAHRARAGGVPCPRHGRRRSRLELAGEGRTTHQALVLGRAHCSGGADARNREHRRT